MEVFLSGYNGDGAFDPKLLRLSAGQNVVFVVLCYGYKCIGCFNVLVCKRGCVCGISIEDGDVGKFLRKFYGTLALPDKQPHGEHSTLQCAAKPSCG